MILPVPAAVVARSGTRSRVVPLATKAKHSVRISRKRRFDQVESGLGCTSYPHLAVPSWHRVQ